VPKDMSEARREAEAARERVAETAEAIVYKLNAPKRLKERVATKVRTAKEQASTRMGSSGGT
jgi:Protein of unknown function (DUF3618)